MSAPFEEIWFYCNGLMWFELGCSRLNLDFCVLKVCARNEEKWKFIVEKLKVTEIEIKWGWT